MGTVNEEPLCGYATANCHSLVYYISQVDPYDYDTIVFILKLIKELSPEDTSSTVDKVTLNKLSFTGNLLTVIAIFCISYVKLFLCVLKL